MKIQEVILRALAKITWAQARGDHPAV